MTFYLLLPVWMAGLFLTRRFLPAPLYCALTVVILLGIQGLLFVIYEPGTSAAAMAGWPSMAATWLPRRNPIALFLHFLTGIIAASVLVRCANRTETNDVDRDIGGGFNRYDILVVLLLAGMLGDLYLETWLPASWPLSASISCFCHFPWMDYHWPLFPILAASLLVALARSRRVGLWFDNPWCRFTAQVSLGFYLWHSPVLGVLERVFSNVSTRSGLVQTCYALCGALVTYGIASLSYALVEKPVLDRFRRPPIAHAGADRAKPGP
jgi:hypothetical protein